MGILNLFRRQPDYPKAPPADSGDALRLKNAGLEADKRRLNARIEERDTKIGNQQVEIARLKGEIDKLTPDAEAWRAKKAKDAAYEQTRRQRPARAKKVVG